MDSKELFVVLVMLWAQVQLFHLQAYSSSVFDVLDFGAVGDGKNDDTHAFLNAWAKVCAMPYPSTLYVPQGKTFLLKPLTFQGPCKSSGATVQIYGNIVAPNGVWNWQYNSESWILFDSVYGLSVMGSGHIDGQGSNWWKCKQSRKCSNAPSALKFNFCNNMKLDGLDINNSPEMHLVLHNCKDVNVSRLTITAPEDSPNTDGIHLQYCQQVEIKQSIIGTGDDCISIGNGSSYIKVEGIHCGPGHGISIGSLGQSKSYAAVEQISVYHCTFNGTMNGARIKTWQRVLGTVLVILGCLVAASNAVITEPISVNVLDYGAVGNGYTDDSHALLKAWHDACNFGFETQVVNMIIPGGRTYLVKPTAFYGPCKPANLNVKIYGNIVAPNGVWNWQYNSESWILFDSVYGLSVMGSGHIDGQGSNWWKCKQSRKCSNAPSALKFNFCNNMKLDGLDINNSPEMHLVLHNCKDVNVSRLTITAPEDSPNTDGIHLQYCQQVEIKQSIIGTGDDCISIGNGSSYIKVEGIHCGPGHGISIGSLGQSKSYAAVEQISVYHCTFNGTMNGARIKTWQGGSGYVRAITFGKLKMNYVDNPIVIDQYYCNGQDNCGNHTSAVKVSNVSFNGLYGSSSNEQAIYLACSQTVGCTDIHLSNVNLKTLGEEKKKALAYCLNVKGASTAPVVPVVPCLSQID